jgi:hypothetical protein
MAAAAADALSSAEGQVQDLQNQIDYYSSILLDDENDQEA